MRGKRDGKSHFGGKNLPLLSTNPSAAILAIPRNTNHANRQGYNEPGIELVAAALLAPAILGMVPRGLVTP